MELLHPSTESLVIVERVTKKEIEAIAADIVKTQMGEGLIDPVKELVIASKLAAYFAERVSQLRSHALGEMKEQKERSALGAKVSKGTNPGKWEYSDAYHKELKAEIKTVEEKAQKSNLKDRIHVTLSGEEITIAKGFKHDGGETVKVNL